MGDEKDYFDKVFSLMQSTLTDNKEWKDRLSKLELRFTVASIIFSILFIIMGSNNPTVKSILALIIK